jgi:hypothetical protein
MKAVSAAEVKNGVGHLIEMLRATAAAKTLQCSGRIGFSCWSWPLGHSSGRLLGIMPAYVLLPLPAAVLGISAVKSVSA